MRFLAVLDFFNHIFLLLITFMYSNCPSVFLDDNTKNIHAAREFGWRSILVGKIGRDSGKPISSDNAEAEINHIHDISLVLPEIFVQQS